MITIILYIMFLFSYYLHFFSCIIFIARILGGSKIKKEMSLIILLFVIFIYIFF